MSLREKLERLDRPFPAPARIPVFPSQKTPPPGAEFTTGSGACWLNRTRYDASFKHGHHHLGEILGEDSAQIGLIARNAGYDHLHPRNLLFVDTETTGLSGGVGTLAFLVGIGYFEGDDFVIEQFFMRDFDEETVLLQAFVDRMQEALAKKGGLASFNGKSYDLPLLLNRAILHRLDAPRNGFPHVDILHAARRFWKFAVPECSLTTIESHILQVDRVGDVPGYLIPEMYFRYLRGGDGAALDAVFYHNQMDILTMVSLLDEMRRLFTGERPPHFFESDWIKIGESYEAIDAADAGMAFYQEALNLSPSTERRIAILRRIAALHKKRECHAEAIPYWLEVLQLQPTCLDTFEELAKAYEHRLTDLETALSYTGRALDCISIQQKLQPLPSREDARLAFERREARLKRKISRGSAHSGHQA